MHPDAAKIVLVEDNLSTHGDASLYAAFVEPRQFTNHEARLKLRHLYPSIQGG